MQTRGITSQRGGHCKRTAPSITAKSIRPTKPSSRAVWRGRTKGPDPSSARVEILRSLIDNELMLQRAEKAGLVANDDAVDARLNRNSKAPYTREEFNKQLKDWGITLEELQGPRAPLTRA